MVKYKGYFAAFAISIIMGLQYIFIKSAVHVANDSEFLLLFLRFLICFVVVAIFNFKDLKLAFSSLKDKNVRLAVLYQPVLNFTSQTYGVVLLSVVTVSMLMSLVPIVNIILARIFLKEKLTKMQYFFVFLACIGSVVLCLNNIKELTANLLGIALILGNIIFRGMYSIYSRKASENVTPRGITAAQILVGVVVFFGLTLVTKASSFGKIPSMFTNTSFIFGLMYLAFFATLAVFYLNNLALKNVKVSVMGVFNAVTAVVACVSGILFLGEHVNMFQIIGGVIILCSSGMVLWINSKKERAK